MGGHLVVATRAAHDLVQIATLDPSG